MLQHTTGEQLKCPHCQQKQVDLVDHYVMPAVIGTRSIAHDWCDHCGGEFEVERTSTTNFTVRVSRK